MKKKYINEGVSGRCFELKNGDILKIFKIPKSRTSLEKYEYFKNYENESIIFPHKLIVEHNQFIGYITKKAEGQPFDESLMAYDIKDMYNHIVTLEKNIDYISKGSIKMVDVHSNNIFYDGNKISVIDPDYYQISHINPEDLFYVNIREVKKLIYDLLQEKVFKSDLNYKNSLYIELRKYVLLDYEVNQMILEYKKVLEKYLEKEITKFEDIGDKSGNMYSRTYRSRQNKT